MCGTVPQVVPHGQKCPSASQKGISASQRPRGLLYNGPKICGIRKPTFLFMVRFERFQGRFGAISMPATPVGPGDENYPPKILRDSIKSLFDLSKNCSATASPAGRPHLGRMTNLKKKLFRLYISVTRVSVSRSRRNFAQQVFGHSSLCVPNLSSAAPQTPKLKWGKWFDVWFLHHFRLFFCIIS